MDTDDPGRGRRRRRRGKELVDALDSGADDLLPAEVAELLHVHRDTVRRMQLGGVLRYREVGPADRPTRLSLAEDVRAEKYRREAVHRKMVS